MKNLSRLLLVACTALSGLHAADAAAATTWTRVGESSTWTSGAYRFSLLPGAAGLTSGSTSKSLSVGQWGTPADYSSGIATNSNGSIWNGTLTTAASGATATSGAIAVPKGGSISATLEHREYQAPSRVSKYIGGGKSVWVDDPGFDRYIRDGATGFQFIWGSVSAGDQVSLLGGTGAEIAHGTLGPVLVTLTGADILAAVEQARLGSNGGAYYVVLTTSGNGVSGFRGTTAATDPLDLTPVSFARNSSNYGYAVPTAAVPTGWSTAYADPSAAADPAATGGVSGAPAPVVGGTPLGGLAFALLGLAGLAPRRREAVASRA